jgi:hypothetical protein
MDETRQIGFRVSESMVERIDQYALDMQERSPGLTVTRTDAIKMLIASGLTEHEKARGGKGKRK